MPTAQLLHFPQFPPSILPPCNPSSCPPTLLLHGSSYSTHYSSYYTTTTVLRGGRAVYSLYSRREGFVSLLQPLLLLLLLLLRPLRHNTGELLSLKIRLSGWFLLLLLLLESCAANCQHSAGFPEYSCYQALYCMGSMIICFYEAGTACA